MRKDWLLMVVFVLALSSLAAHATCADEGNPFAVSTSAASGGRAILSLNNPAGCLMRITNVWATLAQLGTTANSAALDLYVNTNCTGTVLQTYTTMAITGTLGDFREFSANFGVPATIGGSGETLCIGFSTAMTSVVETVRFSGFFTANEANSAPYN